MKKMKFHVQLPKEVIKHACAQLPALKFSQTVEGYCPW